jgi:Ca-activated chloride channel family protein
MSSAAPCRSGFILATAAILMLISAASAQSPAAPPAANADAQSNQQGTPNPSAPANSTSPQSDPQQPDAQQPTAQAPTADDQGSMFVFKKQVEEVVLHATVVDDQQRPVTGLDRSAFSVFERGVPQTITSFRREDVPVAIGIVVDNSGSMRDKREKISQAVMNLIRASNPQDRIFVVNFSQDPYLDQDFTADENLLQAALHRVSTRGSTALYDAIVASAVHFTQQPTTLEKKVILVITDGQDNMSQETLQEAAHRLQQINGPILYAIGLLGSGMQRSGREALQYLAAGTGGVAYFPQTMDEVDSITRTIAHDIRSQYIIAYKPQNQSGKPGYKDVKVEAHASGYGPLTVRTQTGYYPPEPSK